MTKEGAIFPLPFIIAAAILFVKFHQGMNITYLYFSAGLFYLGLIIMLFFRDPDRKVPSGENLIVAPADGKIISLDAAGENPALSIFLSIFNVHVNRSPVDGVVKSITHQKGKFHAAFRAAAMNENERNEIEIETDKGIVKLCQVAGAVARRTVVYKKPGDRVKAGERIGMIRFGSRIDLFLPKGASIEIKLRQKVLAGETVLGRLQ